MLPRLSATGLLLHAIRLQPFTCVSLGISTIPDAAVHLGGGSYSLAGGFWATPGFALQESDSLATPNWSNAPSGAVNPTTVAAALAAKFYRLRKP